MLIEVARLDSAQHSKGTAAMVSPRTTMWLEGQPFRTPQPWGDNVKIFGRGKLVIRIKTNVLSCVVFYIE